ncbi:hypothetical protein Ancab_018952 [Ancistrocladus abbreviatus]
MALKSLAWYCCPVENGVWAEVADSAFGAYTPCEVGAVVFVSNLVLLCSCIYRLWRISRDHKVKRLVMGVSIFDPDGKVGLAPFEVVSLTIEALAWCSILLMLLLETKVYIPEFRWYIRFTILYDLVAYIVLLNLIFSVKEFYTRTILYLCISTFLSKVLFGILLFTYVPRLSPYPAHTPVLAEVLDDNDYEALPGGEQICPERHVHLLSRIYYGWMTPLMEKGYRRPITEKDVWTLDTWDQTETLIKKFSKSWAEESKRSKPWLLRALNHSLGKTFWLGGLFKIGNDLSQFVGPVLLNHLLQSMQ